MPANFSRQIGLPPSDRVLSYFAPRPYAFGGRHPDDEKTNDSFRPPRLAVCPPPRLGPPRLANRVSKKSMKGGLDKQSPSTVSLIARRPFLCLWWAFEGG